MKKYLLSLRKYEGKLKLKTIIFLKVCQEINIKIISIIVSYLC